MGQASSIISKDSHFVPAPTSELFQSLNTPVAMAALRCRSTNSYRPDRGASVLPSPASHCEEGLCLHFSGGSFGRSQQEVPQTA